MKSPRPVIFDDEIRELPDRAGAALAHRAISRVLDILPHTGAEPWPPEAIELKDRLLKQLEQIAVTGDLGPSTFVLGHAGFKESQRILDLLPSCSHCRVAWLCIQAGMTASGMGARSAFQWCHSLVWYIEPRSQSKKAERVVKNANWDDFKKVRLEFEAGELAEETEIHPDSLGPLWPNGPHDWSQYKWRDTETRISGQNEQREEERRAILASLAYRSDALPSDIRDAIDRAAEAEEEGWRHAFFPAGVTPSRKWPAALRKPATPVTKQLHDFYLVHAWGGFFIPKGEVVAPLWIISPDTMTAQKKCMLEWDSALDCFDPEAIEEANRYSESIGMEPDAKLVPCSKRDLLVFAQVHESPDAFFVVTKGPAAGNIYFFDHETGIDFDTPVADSLAGWIEAIADPEHEFDWEWLEED